MWPPFGGLGIWSYLSKGGTKLLGERPSALTVCVTHDETVRRQFGRPRRREAADHWCASPWRLPPFPFAGLPVVAGNTALDHFVTPLIARHDDGSEVAAAEAKRAERHHNDDLQQQLAHDRP